MKSEPSEFSIDDLHGCKNKSAEWDGIRNYQCRNMMRDQMKVGDRAFFYHSNCALPGIVGIMRICTKAYPDATAFDPADKHYDPKSDPQNPRWWLVDVQFEHKFQRTIALQELRQHKQLATMLILRRGNRLSITPVTSTEWKFIVTLADTPPRINRTSANE